MANYTPGKVLYLVCLASFLASCNQSSRSSEEQLHNTDTLRAEEAPDSSMNVTLKTIKADSGWGYDIYVNDKLYIHQPNIPALSGNRGFSSEQDAATAGEFIVYKIENHIMPPSVTPEELDSLGVIH